MTTQGGSIKGSAKITADYNLFYAGHFDSILVAANFVFFAGIADTVLQQYKVE